MDDSRSDSEDALTAFIAQHEGFRSDAYQDDGGVWTIGYGFTFGVKEGDTMTRAEADKRLAREIAIRAKAVDDLVKVPLTDGQRIALIDLAYNIGVPRFRGSTLLRLLNLGNYGAAANQFPRWNRCAGKVDEGLVKRRADERRLFLAGSSGE